ncbi:hypothetical protein Q8A73_013452 [Channa argus]|nr:hypothetical protein Q8A73_013452 [Channa argus]
MLSLNVLQQPYSALNLGPRERQLLEALRPSHREETSDQRATFKDLNGSFAPFVRICVRTTLGDVRTFVRKCSELVRKCSDLIRKVFGPARPMAALSLPTEQQPPPHRTIY